MGPTKIDFALTYFHYNGKSGLTKFLLKTTFCKNDFMGQTIIDLTPMYFPSQRKIKVYVVLSKKISFSKKQEKKTCGPYVFPFQYVIIKASLIYLILLVVMKCWIIIKCFGYILFI